MLRIGMNSSNGAQYVTPTSFMKSRALGPALVALVASLAAACSPGALPISHSPTDPSNPRAEEGRLVATDAAGRGGASHVGHETGASETYVCPMHPEETSPEHGECPKCHMTLVPKK
jgi:hypothetical protein